MKALFASQPRRSTGRRPSSERKTAKGKETLASIAHDASNVAAALKLYCDLLAEPGVLSLEYRTLAEELQTIASAGSSLAEKLAALEKRGRDKTESRGRSSHIDDLADSVDRLKGLLAEVAGAEIGLEVECLSCSGHVRLSREDLTRILIHLTRNAAEATPQGGRIRITVQQGDGGSFLDRDARAEARTALLCVQDSGPSITGNESFDMNLMTRERQPASRRGLGLKIVRDLAESAGGNMRLVPGIGGGARFEVELPLIHRMQAKSGFLADFVEGTNLEC